MNTDIANGEWRSAEDMQDERIDYREQKIRKLQQHACSPVIQYSLVKIMMIQASTTSQ